MIETLWVALVCAAVCLGIIVFSLASMIVVSWAWCALTGDFIAPMFILSLSPIIGVVMVVVTGALIERLKLRGGKR